MSGHQKSRTADDLELLSAYIDGELSEKERVALETRLSEEPALRAELSSLQQTVTLIQTMPSLKAPRDFRLDPAQYGRQQKPSIIPLQINVLRWGSAVGLAASIMLILAGVILGVGGSLENNESTDREPVSQNMQASDTQADAELTATTDETRTRQTDVTTGTTAVAAAPTLPMTSTALPSPTMAIGAAEESAERDDVAAGESADIAEPESPSAQVMTSEAFGPPSESTARDFNDSGRSLSQDDMSFADGMDTMDDAMSEEAALGNEPNLDTEGAAAPPPVGAAVPELTATPMTELETQPQPDAASDGNVAQSTEAISSVPSDADQVLESSPAAEASDLADELDEQMGDEGQAQPTAVANDASQLSDQDNDSGAPPATSIEKISVEYDQPDNKSDLALVGLLLIIGVVGLLFSLVGLKIARRTP